MKLRNLFAGALAISLSTAAPAAIISYGSYTHDDTTDIVVGDGLEWLQWDVTVGMSINDARAQLDTIAGGGWNIASNAQMASLFNNFGFGRTFTDNENTLQLANTGYQYDAPSASAADENDEWFISMFGITNPGSPLFSSYSSSSAFFGNDADQDGYFNSAYVTDDFIWNTSTINGMVGLQYDYHLPSAQSELFGVALVRSQPSQSVPEPASISLLGLGLAALGISRRTRKIAV